MHEEYFQGHLYCEEIRNGRLLWLIIKLITCRGITTCGPFRLIYKGKNDYGWEFQEDIFASLRSKLKTVYVYLVLMFQGHLSNEEDKELLLKYVDIHLLDGGRHVSSILLELLSGIWRMGPLLFLWKKNAHIHFLIVWKLQPFEV